ncbi:MAG TPA: alpha/beta hydrolase-fold protein [Anaerolineales bacterium]
MRLKRIFPFVFFLLAGCSFASKPSPALSPTLSPICGEAGTTEMQSIKSSTPGVPYQFEIYLPPCYASQPDRRYPVLYLIPGRSSAPDTWINAGAARIADAMIHTPEIPPFIIVTTQHTDDDPQAEEIQILLIPSIERTYRILPDRQYHAVAGGSLGGIAAYRIVFQHPDHFAILGIFGSGVEDVEKDRVHAWLAAITEKNKPRVFLNCGLDDVFMLGMAKLTISMLDEFKIPHTEIFTTGDHSYQYWSTNLQAFYRWLTEDWR